MRKRIHFFALLAIAFLGMMTLSACSSGGGGGNHPTVNDIVVLPGSSSVPASQTAQFAAFLNGVSTSVTWTASAGTITGTGAFTAPTAAGSVTITATSGSDTGTATVSVVTAPTLVVNPAALTIPAGGLQSFTATGGAGAIAWSVNGAAFGDCVAPGVGSVNQCHGVIDGNGNYTAPLSPPTGGTVTIDASAGGSSATATATVLYSSASLTTTTSGTGQYAIAFDGVDFSVGNPVDVAGSIVTSGSAGSSSGMITGGEVDLNTGVGGTAFVVPVSGGSFQVGPLDGRTSILLTLASNTVAASYTLQATLATNQHALLIDFDTSDTGSGTLDAQNPTSFATPLNSRFAFQYSGLDSNLFPVTVAGTFLASNNSIAVNNPNSPVNAQDFTYVPVNTNTLTVVTNDITLSGLYTNADSFGRGTITMNSTDLGTINFSYYMIDQTHLKLIEIDPAPQPFILFGEAFSSPTAPTPLTGGVVCTFGGAANDAPYAGGAVFSISGATVSSGGTLDINNSGGAGTQINSSIVSGSYANVLTEGNVPARYTLSLTTSKGTTLFAAYTFATASTTGAELVEIDTNNNVDGASGTAYHSGGVSTVQGSFALNLSGVGSSKSQPAFEQDITGQLGLVNNSTTLSGTLDINNGGPIPGLPVNSTSMLNAVAANGRGTAQVNVSSNGVSAKFNLVYYQIDSNTELLLDADTNRVASGMLIRQF
jgi:hypothetical protein